MGKKKENRYIFPSEEIERYRIHGIAHARISQMSPAPLINCYISLKELLEFDIPKHAWIKYESKAPHIIVSSGKQNHLPKSAMNIKFKKGLESLELKIQNNSNNGNGLLELTPVYTK